MALVTLASISLIVLSGDVGRSSSEGVGEGWLGKGSRGQELGLAPNPLYAFELTSHSIRRAKRERQVLTFPRDARRPVSRIGWRCGGLVRARGLSRARSSFLF